ncbi:unnamed protein product, partial [Prorocentrum cordatum]
VFSAAAEILTSRVLVLRDLVDGGMELELGRVQVRALLVAVWDVLWICRPLVQAVGVDLAKGVHWRVFCSDLFRDGYALHGAPASSVEVPALSRRNGGDLATPCVEAPSEPAHAWEGRGARVN